MRVGSLFSGIGGLDLAIEAHGYEVAWQVENDDYCNKILANHWPEVTRYGDIRAAQFNEFERVDGIVGGFPCQPFSVAGRNRGEDDNRNMWAEVIRAIRALQPGFAFLENVPGLLNHGYFGRILGDLAEAGYDAEWGTFRASDVGAPHRRERLFILAYARREHQHLQQRIHGTEHQGSGGELVDSDNERHESRRSKESSAVRDGRNENKRPAATESSAELVDSDNRAGENRGGGNPAREAHAGPGYRGSTAFPPGPGDRDGWARLLSEMPEAQPAICRDAYGIPDRLDNRAKRLKALGNAVVWPQAALAFQELNRRIINGGETEHDNYNTNGRRPRAGTVKVPGAV